MGPRLCDRDLKSVPCYKYENGLNAGGGRRVSISIKGIDCGR